MDITEYIVASQKISFNINKDGSDHACSGSVRKTKESLVAIVLETKGIDAKICTVGSITNLTWEKDGEPYSLPVKLAQNKTFPLLVFLKQGDIVAGEPPEEIEEAPLLEPEEVIIEESVEAPPKAPPEAAEKPAPAKQPQPQGSMFSQAENKNLTPEDFAYIRDLINEVPQLYTLGPEEVNQLVPFVAFKSYKKGERLFREGDSGDILFFIANGAVDIVKESMEGTHIKLAQFTKDSMLGEMALIDSAPRSASAKITEDAELISLSRDSFDALMIANPAIGLKIFQKIAIALSQNIRFLNGRLADVLDRAKSEGIEVEDTY